MSETVDVHGTVREIKQELHSLMNGVISSSMREKGLTYKVNFGVEFPRLQALASELPHTYELAAALWEEDIRECRLLAGMLMPTDAFSEEVADVWVEQMRFTEEAELTSMNLFARCQWAGSKAFEWIAAESRIQELCGYHTLARLFMQQMKPAPRDAAEFLDHVQADLRSGDTAVRSAAGKALVKFMDLGKAEEQAGERMLENLR